MESCNLLWPQAHAQASERCGYLISWLTRDSLSLSISEMRGSPPRSGRGHARWRGHTELRLHTLPYDHGRCPPSDDPEDSGPWALCTDRVSGSNTRRNRLTTPRRQSISRRASTGCVCLWRERKRERGMITDTSLQSLSESEQEREMGSRCCQSARCGTCQRCSMKTYVFINAAYRGGLVLVFCADVYRARPWRGVCAYVK